MQVIYIKNYYYYYIFKNLTIPVTEHRRVWAKNLQPNEFLGIFVEILDENSTKITFFTKFSLFTLHFSPLSLLPFSLGESGPEAYGRVRLRIGGREAG